MGRYIYLILSILGMALLVGCTAHSPAFKNCCMYDNASIEGICITVNGTEYDTVECFTGPESNMSCIVREGDSTVEMPVCSKSELLKCNSSCVGMFCGSFEFDPRPPVGLVVEDLDENKDKDPEDVDSTQFAGLDREGRAMGLYKGECRILNMTPATIRASTNTNGGFALNIFRFGVGDSFAEFDEAMMYYPLTDLACGINPAGTIDRYSNYMIPNMRAGGGALCTEGGILGPEGEVPQYFCTLDRDIHSYSYQDCALRCSLEHYGDVPAVEPYGAYLTERNGKVAGSPFAYGGPGQGYELKEKSAIYYNWDEYYKNYVGDGDFVDNYPRGFTYYGAEFEKNNYPMNDERGGIAKIIIERGQGQASDVELMDYYSGAEEDITVLEWPGEDDVIENLITVERDPHLVYAYMLSHHSVYSKQFSEGHYTLDGQWAPGAEFECTQLGAGCLSGYCNTQDYHRGVCFRSSETEAGGLEEVQCDCWEEAGGTVCAGRRPYTAEAFDNPTIDITATATLGTLVQSGSSGGHYMSLPSTGKVISYDYADLVGLEEYTGTETQALIIFVGGEQYPTFSRFEYSDELDDMNETLTIPQLLSREKWAGCSRYSDCGKFYTTFVEACMPDYPDPLYSTIHACYRVPTGGWNGQSMHPSTGEIVLGEPSYCHVLRELDGSGISTGDKGGVDENRDTDADIYCYARETDGSCKGWARSALVIQSRQVTYTDGDEEVTATAFGNCILDGGQLRVLTYGYCEQCSYLTIAKDEVIPLPEDEDDPGYEGDEGRKDNKYCPSLAMKTIFPQNENEHFTLSFNGQFGEWESGGTHSAGDDVEDAHYASECTMPDGTEAGKQQAWPDYLPNAYYLKAKIESYLQRNIMPIIFAEYDPDEGGGGLYREWTSDGRKTALNLGMIHEYASHPLLEELYKRNRFSLEENMDINGDGEHGAEYYTGGTFLADSVVNQGAAIIVVKSIMEEDFGGGGSVVVSPPDAPEVDRPIDEMVYKAGRSVNALCPNCMVAVAVGYDESVGSGIPTRMEQVSRFFEYKYGDIGEVRGAQLWDNFYYGLNKSCYDEGMGCDMGNLERVDVVGVQWELGTHNSHCDIEDEEERFAAILGDEVEFGAKVLSRFGKPTVVTDFSLKRNQAGSCWDEGSAERFMQYLGEHVEELVKSGHMGLIYSDWSYDHSGSAGTTYIRTTESGVGGWRGEFFEGTLTAARDFSGFQKSIDVIEVGVAENCTCVPCTSADPAEICNGRFGGTGPYCEYDGPMVMVKWPENCITEEACISADELSTYDIVCSLDAGGETTNFVVGGEQVAANPGLYKQMIAALPDAQRLPCILNKTYRKTERATFLSHPLLFRNDGNLNFDCNPLALGQSTYCGPLPELDMEGMECTLQAKMPGGIPGEVPSPYESGWRPFGGALGG